jgi:hypothetical protein
VFRRVVPLAAAAALALLGLPTTSARIRDYTDVSCGGARTDDMTAPQPVRLGPNPPQFDALRPDTDLVTLTIGATTSISVAVG